MELKKNDINNKTHENVNFNKKKLLLLLLFFKYNKF